MMVNTTPRPWSARKLVGCTGIEPVVPEAADLQSTASPLMLPTRYIETYYTNYRTIKSHKSNTFQYNPVPLSFTGGYKFGALRLHAYLQTHRTL